MLRCSQSSSLHGGCGYSELNDPIDQRARFAAQEEQFAQGDEEANTTDEDEVETVEIVLSKEVVEINEEVEVGINILILVSVLDGLESTF